MTLDVAVGVAFAAIAMAVIAVIVASRASAEAQRLRRRLERLEQTGTALPNNPQTTAAPIEAASALPVLAPQDASESADTQVVLKAPEPARATVIEPPRSVESTIGLTWTTRVGGLLLLAGVVYFFKYAVDRSWLGPWARVAAGAAAGVICIGLAAWLRRRATASYVHVLAGVGLAILLASVWASHAMYGLVPPLAAFVAFSVLVIAGGAAAGALDSEALLTTAVVGAFANPILLAPELGTPAVRLVYPAVIAVAALVVATPRRWSVAASVVLGGGAALVAVWRYVAWEATGGPGVLGLEAAGFAVWVVVVAVSTARWPDNTARTWLLVALGLVAQAGTAAFLGPAPTPTLMAVFAGFVALGWVARRESDSLVGFALLIGAAALTTYGAWEFGAPEGAMVAIGIWALVHVADATVASLRAPPRSPDDDEIASPPLLWQLALAGLVFAALAVELRGLTARTPLAIGAGLTVVAYGIAGFVLDRAKREAASTVGYAMALLFLAAFAWLVAGDAWVGVVWSGLAVVATALVRNPDQRPLVYGALGLLALALLRGMGGDWLRVSEPPWVGPGGRSLLAFGVAVVAVVALSRDHLRPRVAMVVRFAGLLALALWFSLGLRQLATTESAEAMWMTAGLAAFGGAVLALGFARRDVQLRWFGLGLVSVTIAKLLLSDIFLMDGMARTIILIVLGILLLASGFLYARFGARLLGLLQEDGAAVTEADSEDATRPAQS